VNTDRKYGLPALYELLPLRAATPPLLATTADAYEVWKYVADESGVWLVFELSVQMDDREIEALTGYHPRELLPPLARSKPRSLRGPAGQPVLPFPFSEHDLIEFDGRSCGLILEGLTREHSTPEEVVAELAVSNAESALLAQAILFSNVVERSAVEDGPEQRLYRTPLLNGPVEGTPWTESDRTLPMVRRALVAKYSGIWPSIDRDLRDASRNGLAAAHRRNAGWDERQAALWAQSKSKLKGRPADLNAALRSQP
jgi:hypothetical protein